MAQQNLDIIINAQDRTSNAFSSAQSGISGFKNKLESLRPTFQTMAVAGTVAFGAISGVIYKSIEASNEAEKVQAQLGAVLKSTGNIAGVTADQAIKLSDALRKQTTYGDEAILSAENLLLTFTNIKSDVFPDAIKTVLDMSTALGQDLKSSSIQLGKALNDPIQGITALSRVGVSFTQKQKDLIQSLVDSGKTMEAQKIILGELTREFGGSASAEAQTFGGKIKQLKEEIGELAESIGNALKPQLQAIYEKIKPVVENVIAWIERNPELVSKILIASAVLAGFVAVLGAIGLILPAIITGFQIMLGPVGILVAVMALVVTHFSELKGIFDEIWKFLEDTGVIAFFKDVWDQIAQTFNDFLLPAFRDLWTALEPLKPFFEALAKIVGAVLVGAIVLIVKAIQGWIEIFTLLLTAATKIATFFTNVFKVAIDAVTSSIEWLANKIQSLISALSNLWDKAKNFGGKVTSAVSDKLGSLFNVNDAIITPQGRVIQPSKDDYIFATKNPSLLGGGGSTVVNINGGNYLSETAAYELGDQIIKSLQMQMRGS